MIAFMPDHPEIDRLRDTFYRLDVAAPKALL